MKHLNLAESISKELLKLKARNLPDNLTLYWHEKDGLTVYPSPGHTTSLFSVEVLNNLETQALKPYVAARLEDYGREYIVDLNVEDVYNELLAGNLALWQFEKVQQRSLLHTLLQAAPTTVDKDLLQDHILNILEPDDFSEIWGTIGVILRLGVLKKLSIDEFYAASESIAKILPEAIEKDDQNRWGLRSLLSTGSSLDTKQMRNNFSRLERKYLAVFHEIMLKDKSLYEVIEGLIFEHIDLKIGDQTQRFLHSDTYTAGQLVDLLLNTEGEIVDVSGMQTQSIYAAARSIIKAYSLISDPSQESGYLLSGMALEDADRTIIAAQKAVKKLKL